MQSHRKRHSRSAGERKTGVFLLALCRVSLVLTMMGLLFFHGGRDATGWGLAGMVLSLTVVCWTAGVVFSGKASFKAIPGLWVFLLLLGVGGMQLSPSLSAWCAPESVRQFWQGMQDLGLPSGTPVVALLPAFHAKALQILLIAALFYVLCTQLFSGPKGILGAYTAILGACVLTGLLGLVQHFGGHDWLLWMYKGKTSTVSGPFFNKNHFAFLQELGVFTALGLCCALYQARRGSTLYALVGKARIPLFVFCGLSLLVCLLGLLFSYSRAGIFCTVAGLVLFALYAVWKTHKAGTSLLSLGAVCIGVGLASFYGLDVLTSRLELALSGEDPSGLVRWEIWKTALSVIGVSPFWGTGFGAFRYLSPMFEPSYAVGTISFNAHNDFLELAAAVGIPGAVLVVGWLLFLFCRNTRVLLWAGTRSSFQFIGAGAALGLLVTAGHEFFDYGLQQPGNLLVWIATAVVLGHTVCWLRTRTALPVWHLGRPLYVVPVALMVPAWLLFGAGLTAFSEGRALNRIAELQDVPEIRQAFTPVALQRAILKQGEAVLALESSPLEALDAMAQAYRGLAFLRQSELLADQLSIKYQRTISPERVWMPVYAEDLPVAFAALGEEARSSVAVLYRQAAVLYERMLALAPTNALALSLVAKARDDAASWERQDGTAVTLYDRACALYPYNGEIAAAATGGYWRWYQEQRLAGQEGKEAFQRLVAMTRRTGSVSPAHFTSALALLWEVRPDAALLAEVTPQTLSGQEQLSVFLTGKQQWEAALEAQERMEAINAQRPEEETPETVGTVAFLRRDSRSKQAIALLLAERRATVYAAKGNMEQARQYAQRSRELRYAERTDEIAKIDTLLQQGEYLLAEERLKRLPDDPRALVRYAEILWIAQRFELLGRKLSAFEACADLADESTRERMERIAQRYTSRPFQTRPASEDVSAQERIG